MELSPNWFSAVQHAHCRTQFWGEVVFIYPNKTNRKRNFLQTKYQLVNKQTNRIWNFLQTGFKLFNMLNAAHNYEERSSSYILSNKQTNRKKTFFLTFLRRGCKYWCQQIKVKWTFYKLVFSCSTCSMPHTILKGGRLHIWPKIGICMIWHIYGINGHQIAYK